MSREDFQKRWSRLDLSDVQAYQIKSHIAGLRYQRKIQVYLNSRDDILDDYFKSNSFETFVNLKIRSPFKFFKKEKLLEYETNRSLFISNKDKYIHIKALWRDISRDEKVKKKNYYYYYYLKS